MTASLVGLALVPTLVGFLVFFALISEIGPVRTTVVTYVNPAVALVLGVVLLGEPFTLGLGLGFPSSSPARCWRRAAVAPPPGARSPAAESLGGRETRCNAGGAIMDGSSVATDADDRVGVS